MLGFRYINQLSFIYTELTRKLISRLQLARQALNSEREWAYFEHYYVQVDYNKNELLNFLIIPSKLQTLFMMLGETLCFGGYFIMKYIIHRKDPEAFDGNAKPVNPLLMLPVKRSVYY